MSKATRAAGTLAADSNRQRDRVGDFEHQTNSEAMIVNWLGGNCIYRAWVTCKDDAG